MQFVNRSMGADYPNDDLLVNVPSLGETEAVFSGCSLSASFHALLSCLALARGGNKNLSQRVLCYARGTGFALMMSRYEILASLSRSEKIKTLQG
jgi:hypothetical protein